MKKKWLAIPYIVWMCIFIVIPLFLIGYYAFTDTLDDGTVVFSLVNMKNVFTKDNMDLIVKSLKMAFVCTIICLVLAYPIALILSGKHFSEKPLLLFLFVIPMWMNFLLRTYAWRYIFEDVTWLNNIRAWFGLAPTKVLFTDFAVMFGMVYNFLPFMILPIHTVLAKINPRVIEAAQDLGANKVNVFSKVIFPLSLPGVTSGITMVFVPAISTFIISRMLGGGSNLLIGDLIEMQFLGNSYNPHLGAAISLVLMAIVLVIMTVMNQFSPDDQVLI